MEQGLGDFAWKSVEELGVGPDAQRALAESIRAKTLEFEREREAYIDTAKQLLTPPLPPSPIGEPPGASIVESSDQERGANGGEAGGGGGARWPGVTDHHQQPRRRRLRPGGMPKATSLREARDEWRLASENIRNFQQRKADAEVRLQAERLSNLEHRLELGVLRLERLLDRDRILELLRLTDPNRPAATRAAGAAKITKGEGGLEGRGVSSRGGTDYANRDGGDGAKEDEEVSEELIERLEERVAAAEERMRVQAARVGASLSGRLEERARREEDSRREEALARDEVVRLQTALRGKEERLANTVVSYLELRHAMLRAQRTASEAREDAAKAQAADEETMRDCEIRTAEQKKAVKERVNRTCDDVGAELHRQIQLREDEASMLREQRAEVEGLYEARAVRLESVLKEWKAKYAALRRRFLLETEGFRRDADNIGRRFERIRAGPPGGRPAISSRSGSSARLAVENAIYSGDAHRWPRRLQRASCGRWGARIDRLRHKQHGRGNNAGAFLGTYCCVWFSCAVVGAASFLS